MKNISCKIFLLLLIVLLLLVLAGCTEELRNIEINDVNVTSLDNGEYIGQFETKLISAKVNVLVEEKQITGIDILEHKHGFGKKGEKIVDSVIAEQSLKVDAISGATYSSNVILKAIERALNK